MRWDQLFGDLEGQLAHEQRRDLDLEVADRTRRERALIGLHERLLATLDGRFEAPSMEPSRGSSPNSTCFHA